MTTLLCTIRTLAVVWIVVLAGACGGDEAGDGGRDGGSDVLEDEAGDGAMADGQADAMRQTDAAAEGHQGASDSVCVKNCATAASLGCAHQPENCVELCEAGLWGTCGEVHRALATCAAARSADDYFCDEYDESSLKPLVCAADVEAVAYCVTHR